MREGDFRCVRERLRCGNEFRGQRWPCGRSEIAPYLEVAITVKDGEEPAAVASEKVRGMFEATSDLGDWDGDAKLTPGVTEITSGSGSTLRFRVTPDSTGNSERAFLRVKVK